MVKLAYEFWVSVRRLKGGYSSAEQIALYQKSNAVYDAVYETADDPFALVRKMRNYQGMAESCLENGMVDEAFVHLREAAECARLHDELPRVVHSEALLLNAHSYDRAWESKEDLRLRKALLSDLTQEDEFYGGVRGAPGYAKLVGRLKG